MPWFLAAAALTCAGIALVASATADPANGILFGAAAKAQVLWWAVSVAVSLVAARIPFAWWKELAVPGYIASLLVILAMGVLAGSSLMPPIKGQCNWIVLGPFRIQPVEFIKLATLMATALLISSPGFEARRLGHVCLGLVVAALPAAMLAREDLGSALTFPPMAFGMLMAAGMRGRDFTLLMVGGLAVITLGISRLPQEGAKAYQYRRIQAWLHPEAYALTEGYQTARSVSAIGSGQYVGKGWSQGDQNRLGLIPEKHTDLISAVAGEEFGLIGMFVLCAGYVTFAWLGLGLAGTARDPCGRLIIVGFVCLLGGQAAINLSVATGLLPVTGITLPFLSYGGSSLLATWLGLGIARSAGRATQLV